MQRLIYSIVSVLIMLGLLLFALPIFLIFASVLIIFILIGLLTGRSSFRVYRSQSSSPPRPQEPASPRGIDKGVIDITEDQEKK